MIAGIETGGTKVVLGVAAPHALTEPVQVHRLPTADPRTTLARVAGLLAEVDAAHGLDAVGLATFGPVNVDPGLPRFGWIVGTAKPGWSDTPLLEHLGLPAGVPVALLSDVSGAALGEHRFGAGRGVGSIAYATFGTGVGVGLVQDGRVRHGNGFPEIGHLLLRRHPADGFAGACPFHGDCAEGLAAGPAVLARWGADASHLPAAIREEAFAVLGYYIAQVAAAVAYLEGVERVVVGGGVLKAPGLLEEARRQLLVVTGGPQAGHPIASSAAEFLVPPALGDSSGVLGALAAAARLLPDPERAAALSDVAPRS